MFNGPSFRKGATLGNLLSDKSPPIELKKRPLLRCRNQGPSAQRNLLDRREGGLHVIAQARYWEAPPARICGIACQTAAVDDRRYLTDQELLGECHQTPPARHATQCADCAL